LSTLSFIKRLEQNGFLDMYSFQKPYPSDATVINEKNILYGAKKLRNDSDAADMPNSINSSGARQQLIENSANMNPAVIAASILKAWSLIYC